MIRRLRAGRSAATALSTFLLLGSFFAAAAQSPSSGGDRTPAQAPSEKQADDSAAPAQPKRARKVITNDDLDADRARASAAGEKSSGGIPATGMCDAQCAEEAREMTGMGPEREGEWQVQLAAARRNLSADTQWSGAYWQATQAVRNFCTFQYQQQAAALPSGSDFQSRVERARRQKYAEEMGRVLGQTVANASARIERLIQEAGDAEPVRAAIMRVLSSRLTNSCDDSDDP
jgi:hypothetical protein